MEKWDLYTRNRELTGREQIRGEAIPEGFYHLVVHVWLKNKQGQYLISKRSADRPTYPLFWECTGGSVLLGETSLHGAAREVKEEVGVDLEPGFLRKGKMVAFSRTLTERRRRKWRRFTGCGRMRYGGFTTAAGWCRVWGISFRRSKECQEK